MTFFLAPALVQLKSETDSRFPDRDRASDGWIGDASHAAAVSDHNPCWRCTGRSNGIVRAIDIDISPDGRPNVDLRKRLLKVLIGDPRVWYVISNGIIYSRTYNWVPRRYTGANGHFEHVHVSLNGANGVNPEGNFDTSPWFPEEKEEPELGENRRENFRDSKPDWDIKIIDRAIENGRIELKPAVRLIESAVDNLPDDEGDTRVSEFKETFENRRVLKMSLLNDAVADGRTGTVKNSRDRIQAALKKILF